MFASRLRLALSGSHQVSSLIVSRSFSTSIVAKGKITVIIRAKMNK